MFFFSYEKKKKNFKPISATNNETLCCEVYNLFKVTYHKTQIKEVFVLCTFMPLLSGPVDFMAPSHFINDIKGRIFRQFHGS